jgi:hypothetical protein
MMQSLALWAGSRFETAILVDLKPSRAFERAVWVALRLFD